MRSKAQRRHGGRPRGVAVDENLAMMRAGAEATLRQGMPVAGGASGARRLVQIEGEYGRRLGTAQRLLVLERLARGEGVDAIADWLWRLEQARCSLNDPAERAAQQRP